ncbi:MAG: ribosome small subunit-dependent GTPase A [Anaerolineales bacterium]|nr:ribosome small subunit-dependent GTPase A [Anaerolineales bacterium]
MTREKRGDRESRKDDSGIAGGGRPPGGDALLTGMVVKAQSGFYTVRTEHGRITCQLRGRLKKKRVATDLAAVGDRVRIMPLPDGTGAIEEILPRNRVLSRSSPSAGGRRGFAESATEQVIVANPDQAVFIFACAEPAPHLRMLDRFLVAAERAEIPAVVCANKTDLAEAGWAEAHFGLYRKVGYPVLFTSARTGAGVDQFRAILRGKLSVLSGPSGVGKSSLLNAVQPGLGLAVSHVSHSNRKGRHTTVAPELIELEEGGYVADTPGLRAIAFWDIAPEELDAYFPEIRPLVEMCEFGDCTHEDTPGCAVIRAVAEGKISPERYDSYLRLRHGET